MVLVVDKAVEEVQVYFLQYRQLVAEKDNQQIILVGLEVLAVEVAGVKVKVVKELPIKVFLVELVLLILLEVVAEVGLVLLVLMEIHHTLVEV